MKELTGPSQKKAQVWPYEIRVFGRMDERWSEWFHGLKLDQEQAGDQVPITIISCPSIDQAMLRGILNKIWDLNLSVISVIQTARIDTFGS